MIIIASYESAFNSKTQKYHIISLETSVCPICFSKLVTKDYRDRICLTDDGKRQNLMIRRLRCKSCGKTHSELPDMLVPYKHYASIVLESVLDGGFGHHPADNSTLRRWRQWLPAFLLRAEALLRAIRQNLFHKQAHVFSDSSHVRQFMSIGNGWLGKLFRPIINSGFH